jgi:hypothetical protein
VKQITESLSTWFEADSQDAPAFQGTIMLDVPQQKDGFSCGYRMSMMTAHAAALVKGGTMPGSRGRRHNPGEGHVIRTRCLGQGTRRQMPHHTAAVSLAAAAEQTMQAVLTTHPNKPPKGFKVQCDDEAAASIMERTIAELNDAAKDTNHMDQRNNKECVWSLENARPLPHPRPASSTPPPPPPPAQAGPAERRR